MKFSTRLAEGRFLKRYKRFLADIEIENGQQVTVYCPNTGKMTDLLIPGSKVLLSPRCTGTGLPYTWEMTEIGGIWIGVNTHNANRLVEEAIINKTLFFNSYNHYRREVSYNKQTRFDFFLESTLQSSTGYIEVKNVHLKRHNKAFFPDTVTERGRKHIQTLTQFKVENPDKRAIVLYIVQREDCNSFSIARDIDPAYAMAAQDAFNLGVEFIAYRCKMTPWSIEIDQQITVCWEND